MRIGKETASAQPAIQPTTPYLRTSRPLKMESKAKRPRASPTQVARVIKLIDELKKSAEPLLKKKKKTTALEAMAPIETMQD